MTPPHPSGAIFVTGWGHAADSLANLRAALHLPESAPLLAPAELDCTGLSSGEGELLDRLKGRSQPTPIIAWSMGAMLALEAAARAPDCLQALVLLAPTARFCSDTSYHFGIRDLTLRRMIARLELQPQETLRDFLCNAAHPELLTGDPLANAVQAGLRIPVSILAQGLEYLRRTDLRDCLSRVRVPVLIVHGDADRIVPCGASEVVAAQLPAATRSVIPGAGHMLPRFHLNTLHDLITAFLASLP